MAKLKPKPRSILRQEHARTTWTRFRLPPEKSWVEWPAEYPDRDLGPLADVSGRLTVRLGRMVLHPENAALIVLWESAEALDAFRSSSPCAVVLQTLGCMGDPLHGLRWQSGFPIGERRCGDYLYGRIILDILTVEGPLEEGHKALWDAQKNFRIKGSEDLHQRPWLDRRALAWVDVSGGTPPPSPVVWYQFYRWNDQRYTAEREEMAVRNPGTHQTWTERVARAMPPVVAWIQERWDIDFAACHRPQTLSEYEREEAEREGEREEGENWGT